MIASDHVLTLNEEYAGRREEVEEWAFFEAVDKHDARSDHSVAYLRAISRERLADLSSKSGRTNQLEL